MFRQGRMTCSARPAFCAPTSAHQPHSLFPGYCPGMSQAGHSAETLQQQQQAGCTQGNSTTWAASLHTLCVG